MTLKERCQAGEAKLEQVSTALLDPRPEILDRCEAELQEVIAIAAKASRWIRPRGPISLRIKMTCCVSGNGSGCWACRCNRPRIYARAGPSWA